MSSGHIITQRRKCMGLTQEKLGNHYGSTTGGSWGNTKEKSVFFENFKVKPVDPDARSISFKYLFARKILTFELRDLPLPS